MSNLHRCLRKAASLRLTLSLLAAALVLVFVGTLHQTNLGIFEAQEKYFRSFLVWFQVPGLAFPLPLLAGGYLLGGLLLLNLLAGMATRLRLHWSKCGIWAIHGGLLLFVAAELCQAWMTEEGTMRLEEGGSRNYFEAMRETELVVIDASRPEADRIVAVPERLVREGRRLALADLPFELHVRRHFRHSAVTALPGTGSEEPLAAATRGLGRWLAVAERAPDGRNGERNLFAAVVEIREGEASRGTWLLSNALSYPQTIRAGDREYLLAIRPKRHYQPYSLTLLQFRHERHPGTDLPRHFSSRLRLTYAESREDRAILISMNEPFRYRGHTYYQAGFDDDDTTSILRVVRNPGWRLPYIATAVTGLGLLAQFGLGLFGFLQRRKRSAADLPTGRRSTAAAPDMAGGAFEPVLIVALIAAVFLAAGWNRGGDSLPDELDAWGFGAIPVQAHGRVQPMDSVARNALLHLQGKTRVTTAEGQQLAPPRWLLDVLFRPEVAAEHPVFRLNHPELTRWLKGDAAVPAQASFSELKPRLAEIVRQAVEAEQVEAADRSAFQRHLLGLARALDLYGRLQEAFPSGGPGNLEQELARLEEAVAPGLEAVRVRAEGEAFDEVAFRKILAFNSRYRRMERQALLQPLPPQAGQRSGGWRSVGGALLERIGGSAIPPELRRYAELQEAFRAGDGEALSDAVAGLARQMQENHPAAARRADQEATFNRRGIFNRALALYAIGLISVSVSWMRGSVRLRQAGFWILVTAFFLHTGALAFRMYLHGRPPVTNLYASAIFVGWGSVLLGLVLERIFRDGLAAAGAGMVGVGTLIVAHQLSLAGDTLENLRAVLDSNFWLATHVIVITLGYSAVFLAGGMAAFGILRGRVRPGGGGDVRRLAGMVYGVLCFATLFTFVGTVLGGIWADQSWGRFWGWDPKENGALMVVLWNVMILHARLGGIIRERGILVMAVFGNAITAFAWFGVNLLGVGLHSYGFMEGGFGWLVLFAAANGVVVAIGLFSLRKPALSLSAAGDG